MQNDKKTYNLFLDDVRVPDQAWMYTQKQEYLNLHWKIVKTYDQFVDYITRNYSNHNALPELISFDHDLADEHYSEKMYASEEEYNLEAKNFKEKTGYDCTLWLIDFCIDNNIQLPKYFCHSMNPVGKEKILGLLNNYKKYEKNF